MTLVTDAPPRARESVYRPRHPLDLLATVGMLRRGATDPTMIIEAGRIWMTFRTDAGIATLCLRGSGAGVRATAWGPGAGEALDRVPALCGADDDPSGFDLSSHPALAEIARRHPGIRMTRTGRVFDALACAIIEQKVTGMQAFGAWRHLVTRYGERAPGPTPRPMFAAPSPEIWRTVPSWAFHRARVEPPQARTIARSAQRASSIERAALTATDGEGRDRVLTSLPGGGPWTSAATRIRALGDPDAGSVGDFHLAHEGGHPPTGDRTDDDGKPERPGP